MNTIKELVLVLDHDFDDYHHDYWFISTFFIWFFPSVNFFSGEGPRRRRYGRIAAMTLIVPPYDEDYD
jgi:hypothetical protein